MANPHAEVLRAVFTLLANCALSSECRGVMKKVLEHICNGRSPTFILDCIQLMSFAINLQYTQLHILWVKKTVHFIVIAECEQLHSCVPICTLSH